MVDALAQRGHAMTGLHHSRYALGLLAVMILTMAATPGVAQRKAGEMRPAVSPFLGNLVVCKALLPPNFLTPAQWNFSVAPGNHLATTPYQGCSAAMTLVAGTYVITEQQYPGSYFNTCSATPAGSQVAYHPTARTSTVIVHAGATTTATIANGANPPCTTPCQ
jgi:hypothetical protein